MSNTNREQITKAVSLLRAGVPFAMPTETVYGLACDAANDIAVKKVFEIKGRPSFNPLISHYASLDEVKKDVLMNDLALKLAQCFWPGPLTMVLPKTANSRIGDLVTAGLSTAAVRIPRHELTLELLAEFAGPVAAPSANPSSRLSPVAAAHVEQLFAGALDFVLDGGKATCGLESTVVEVLDDELIVLRPGTIAAADLAEICPKLSYAATGDKPRSPGMLLKHYSPRTPLRLGSDSAKADEALLAFGQLPANHAEFAAVYNLSASADLNEAAANLYSMLHEIDTKAYSSIAVMSIPEEGLGKAINDRLRRAL